MVWFVVRNDMYGMWSSGAWYGMLWGYVSCDIYLWYGMMWSFVRNGVWSSTMVVWYIYNNPKRK